MSVLYKRLVLFVAFALLIIALRIFDNGLCSINGQGRYTAFLQNGEEIVYDNIPLFNERGAYERIDFSGNTADAMRFLSEYCASVCFTENASGIEIFYAYSPLISGSVCVHGHAVNLMVACSGSSVTVGSPLIKGSY